MHLADAVGLQNLIAASTRPLLHPDAVDAGRAALHDPSAWPWRDHDQRTTRRFG